MATLATLQRISASALSKLMLAERSATDPSFAIVDVRDDDYIGGHIKGSQNIPSLNLDHMLPTLVRKLQGKKMVVFHCALSQQRGPGAALRYLRERERLLSSLSGVDSSSSTVAAASTTAKEENLVQTVYVLDGGFVGWRELYGEDETLTEGYRKKLWKDGI